MGSCIAVESKLHKMQYSYSETVDALPENYVRLMDRDEKKHKETTLSLFHWLITQVGFHLDISAANVLRFIVARTYGYYKEAELISVRQMRDGVWDIKSNRPLCCPVIKDERTTRKALTVLERLGYITRYRVTVNNVDTLSLVHVHADAILKDEHTKEDELMLRQRKKDRGTELQEVEEPGENAMTSSILRGVQKCSTGVLQKCSSEYINKEDIKNPSCSEPRNALRVVRSRSSDIAIDFKNDTAEMAIAKAVTRVTEKREKKASAAARALIPSLSEFNALWASVMVEAFGSCTVSGLTHREYGMLKRIAKAHTLNCSWRVFLSWVVNNWSAINRESKELREYHKKRGDDWSLADEDRIFLGSSAPDTFMLIKNFGKLVKRFAQTGLKGKEATGAQSATVVRLQEELIATRRQRDIGTALLNRAIVQKPAGSDATPVARKRGTILDPGKDRLFAEDTDSLPEWR